jgi:hypothetical protein
MEKREEREKRDKRAKGCGAGSCGPPRQKIVAPESAQGLFPSFPFFPS